MNTSRHQRMPPALGFVTGICPSGKRAYFTRKGARVLVRVLKAEGDKGVRAYHCPQCDHFHAGHMPDAVRQGEITANECYRRPVP